MRNFASYLLVTLKGIGMGAADVIPGVSGGTIAFLTGIYEELLDSIKSLNSEAVKLLFTGRIKAFWKHINGNFLVSLILGIGISFMSLAKLMTYLMVHQPIPLWSFFFGLILVSAFMIFREINFRNFKNILSLIIGIAFGATICLISPAQTSNSLWFIFLCGAIAICAMILPGISGSFILLLLGKYQYMLTAINTLTDSSLASQLSHQAIIIVIVFIAGAAIGITSFSHLLSWMLKKFYFITISFLGGLMLGSLVKVWPWQLQLESGVSRPALPNNELLDSLHSGHIGLALLFAAIGIILILTIELTANKLKSRKQK